MPGSSLPPQADALSTRELAHAAVRLGARLVREQGALAAAELRQELGRIESTALLLGAGTGLLALCGGLSVLSLAALIERYGGLPRWAAYGAAAGATGVSGLGLLALGKKRGAEAARQLTLPETTQALRENIAWLEEQLKPLAD